MGMPLKQSATFNPLGLNNAITLYIQFILVQWLQIFKAKIIKYIEWGYSKNLEHLHTDTLSIDEELRNRNKCIVSTLLNIAMFILW